jgi:RimJ/RimL family protein N-acetyltransferase
MLAYVTGALRAAHEGTRIPFAIRVGGRVVGSTSYYGIDAANGQIAIGHTFLARPQWRTGINREAKLLLLTRAFEELGCERVELHTDIRNERSQRAIEGIGATREGVLRRHRRRPDGSWRDTVLYAILSPDWPTVRARLTAPH